MKKFFVFLLSIVVIFSCCACKKKDNLSTLGENLTNYDISLEVDVSSKFVTAQQSVDYINNTDSVLKTIKFHLYPQYFKQGATEKIVPSTKMNSAYPNGMSFAEFNINRVQVDNTDKNATFENEFDSILCVNLNKSLMPNERANIYIEYSFILPNCHHRFGYGNNTINLANFYPIVCVFENGSFNTQGYNANGDPFYSDMANYCVNLTVANQYVVASTGEKISEKIEDSNKLLQFNAKMVRDFALVLSNKFQVVNDQINGVNITYYYFNDSHPNQSIKAGMDAIKTFSKLFGNYPYSTFSIVECDFVHGGMEYPNLIMISSEIEHTDDFLNVIIHETAHQWWYGIVGNDEYKYPWLDESLTEFSTVLFYDNCEGYNFSHKQMINLCKENYSIFISVYEDVLGNINTSMRPVDEYSTEPEYTYCTYVKGVLMFESLYQLIGEKDFVNGLKIYFENNKYTNSTPNDLICAFEESSNQNLENFFNSWINGKVIIR